MAQTFYSDQEYKEKQSRIAKTAWQKRLLTFKYKTETRKCARPGCDTLFTVPRCDPKRYCSQSCGTRVANVRRGSRSPETKRKISQALIGKYHPHTGHIHPFKGSIKVPRKEIICANSNCGKKFLSERWKKAKYCSRYCLIRDVGSRPTSPKASKGKNGIRPDISPTINFYSRWEANIARLFTLLKIKWEYAPQSFDIGGQRYTPDFYLPDKDAYVEVKNFWWPYSRIRDQKFRERYPNIRLEVILKDEYMWLERYFSHLVPHWEYKNSKL